MKYEIEIDEKAIAKIIEQEIANRIVEEYRYENTEAGYGIRLGVDKAIKEYIYSKKDEIIERVVNRASIEIVKKGIPKLLDNLKQ